jgi:hypothetical protein
MPEIRTLTSARERMFDAPLDHRLGLGRSVEPLDRVTATGLSAGLELAALVSLQNQRSPP